MRVGAVPVDRTEIIGAHQLAAGAERSVEHRHRHRIALRTVDHIARHRAVGGQQRHLLGHSVAAAAVEDDEVLRTVDRIRNHRRGDDAVFRDSDVLHVAVQPRGGLGLLVHGQPLFHLGHVREQVAVLASERKVMPDVREHAVHAADHLIRTRQQPGLRVVGRVGVIADGYHFEHDEQHHDIDASDKL